MMRLVLGGIVILLMGVVIGAWKRGGNNTPLLVVIGLLAVALFFGAPYLLGGAP